MPVKYHLLPGRQPVSSLVLERHNLKMPRLKIIRSNAQRGSAESRSCGSSGDKRAKEDTKARNCMSYEFDKPNLAEVTVHKVMDVFRGTKAVVEKLKGCCKYTKKDIQSLEESKRVIQELAAELYRVSQNSEVLSRACKNDDTGNPKECKKFILEWAEELKPTLQKIVGVPPSERSSEVRGAEEQSQSEPTEPQSPAQELKMKDSQHILSEWAKSLRSLPEGSVSAGQDVTQVLEELGSQWKRGLLPNILPILEFIMWSVIRDRPEEGTIPHLWLSTKQRFRCADAVQHIPDSVWKWINNMSDDVQLDPKTANPGLKLSEDGKRVQMGVIIESTSSNYPVLTSQKYDGWWCVVGKEGFTSGRHYWEVQLSGKQDWRVGVIRESAPRNGFVDLNTRTGYWTLRLQNSHFRALTLPATILSVKLVPSRLGVYLDIEEGQLSFYNVERRSHIYTFNATFTEKVYPVFGTTETGIDLEIVDTGGEKRMRSKNV
ncbi:E3 ubiquitin-protein ligase TRIM39-like isoform X2 [Lepisosteus oculatus]|uniref:E3 ubiquitin-protein ligase TRIM39-like isoform X2 n=1 Tax=Lepisosteus oculatus TaxID=7918 RepID=UPI00073FF2D0|nr:PREDICTED: E3 ubiquitin-protein ligase TRIM39-like isoform X2 [Lepisosteus oculatus]